MEALTKYPTITEEGIEELLRRVKERMKQQRPLIIWMPSDRQKDNEPAYLEFIGYEGKNLRDSTMDMTFLVDAFARLNERLVSMPYSMTIEYFASVLQEIVNFRFTGILPCGNCKIKDDCKLLRELSKPLMQGG